MKLTPEIINALKMAVSQAGNQTAFAEKTGLKHQNISRYLNGKVTKINPKSMSALLPELKPFLPGDFVLPGMMEATSHTAPNDSELEILKRDAKLAQCRLQIAYLERKVKRLQELNFKEGD